MSNISRYLQNANRSLNEQFVGADGFLDDDMYFAGGEDFFTYADGTPAPQAAAAASTPPRSPSTARAPAPPATRKSATPPAPSARTG